MDAMSIVIFSLVVLGVMIGFFALWQRRRIPSAEGKTATQISAPLPPSQHASSQDIERTLNAEPDLSVQPQPVIAPDLASGPSGGAAEIEAAPDDGALLEDHVPPPDTAKAAGVSPAPEPARFSTYYPKEVAPRTWTPLIAYVFRISAADAVAADAADALKDRLSEFRPVSGEATVPLEEGVLITATPNLPGFQFNPPSASVAFYEQWHALPFKLRATGAPLDQAANGRINFSVDGVIVADLPISIFVTTQPSTASTAPSNATADPYDAIFCSYSHKDTAIVERVERAYKALGIDYLRDVTTLRSGEEWNPRLLAMIDEADIFQLFWSNASAESRYVQQEWEHALSLGRSGAFIRPVYWQQPMPKAPEKLSHLHFHFDPELADSR